MNTAFSTMEEITKKFHSFPKDENVEALLNDVFASLPHHPSGPMYTNLHKQKGVLNFNKGNELQSIFHFYESHAPSLRVRTSVRFDRSCMENGQKLPSHTLQKEFVDFKCKPIDEVEQMLQHISEMPSQWTIVQLTAVDIASVFLPYNERKFITPTIYISRFNCGQRKQRPVCVKIDPPLREIARLIHELLLYDSKIHTAEPAEYSKNVDYVGIRLKNIVHKMENRWLGPWRCLLLGKLKETPTVVDMIIELTASIADICDQFRNQISDRQIELVKHIAMGIAYLQEPEIHTIISDLFPNDTNLSQLIISKLIEFNVNFNTVLKGARYPVILVVDQHLDIFPWEACGFLATHPVSRLPSLHFVYGLFKEHEMNIKDGFIECINPYEGAFVINPDQNLPNMEKRMRLFYEKCLPEWKGTIGIKPTPEEFKQLLLNANIFAYSGHGCGTQYLAGDEIQKLRVNAVVMLFGCASVGLESKGGLAELAGAYQNYLIACSPLVIGNLYRVRDRDMDNVSTELIRLCIPNKRTNKWKFVDKRKWNDGLINFSDTKTSIENPVTTNDVLEAVALSRKAATNFTTAAALIARGLPVKLHIPISDCSSS